MDFEPAGFATYVNTRYCFSFEYPSAHTLYLPDGETLGGTALSPRSDQVALRLHQFEVFGGAIPALSIDLIRRQFGVPNIRMVAVTLAGRPAYYAPATPTEYYFASTLNGEVVEIALPTDNGLARNILGSFRFLRQEKSSH
jgi:hypothetical protein